MNFSDKISSYLKKGILISPEILNQETQSDQGELPHNITVLNKDILQIFSNNNKIDTDLKELDKARVLYEKGNTHVYDTFVHSELNNKQDAQNKLGHKVDVVFSYDSEPKKRTFNDFVSLFNSRFNKLEALLRARPELQGLTMIRNLNGKKDKEVSIIGMVSDKSITKNDNIILKLEDASGKINVLISKNKKDIYTPARDIVLDEVIGITGVFGDNIIFVNNVIFPDITFKELKKSPEEEYAVFIGDIHMGSTVFLEKEFKKFLYWLNGQSGNQFQKNIASKIKYLFIAGDLVDGVGIYPGQEDDLHITDIKKQYDALAELLKLVPSHVQIILCSGNHDAGRIAEPQPQIYTDFSEAIWNLPNVTIVSNPAFINIGATEDFGGFDVLLYHGYSLIYYADNVESIRVAGGQKRPDLLLKFLLKRRHLAPTHESTLYIPDANADPLIIDKIPDFFVTGHIHRVSVSAYRNVSLLNCSCWVSMTEDQEKRGLVPQPGRVIVVNLQTRDSKIMNFYHQETTKK